MDENENENELRNFISILCLTFIFIAKARKLGPHLYYWMWFHWYGFTDV